MHEERPESFGAPATQRLFTASLPNLNGPSVDRRRVACLCLGVMFKAVMIVLALAVLVMLVALLAIVVMVFLYH